MNFPSSPKLVCGQYTSVTASSSSSSQARVLQEMVMTLASPVEGGMRHVKMKPRRLR